MNVSIKMRGHSRFYNKYGDPTLRWKITYVGVAELEEEEKFLYMIR